MHIFFPDNFSWSIRINHIIDDSYLGGGSFGEIVKVLEKLDTKDPESWPRAFVAMGDNLRALAEDAESEGIRQVARDRYLRASNYYIFGLRGMPHDDLEMELDIYKRSVECFRRGIEGIPNIEPVKVPYEDSYLSGYFVNASQQGEKRPVVVIFDGSEGSGEKMFFVLGRDCPKYGFSALCMDDPGNGAAIRLNGMHSRYDSEVPAKAYFNYLETRTDVDQQRVALLAPSIGGYFAPRAVAFEKRYAACIAWGALFEAGRKPHEERTSEFVRHGMWYMGVDSVAALRKKVAHYNLREVAPLVECPTLILHGEDDHIVPLSEAYRLNEALQCPKKIKIFTKEDGGEQHCQAGNALLAREEIFSWLISTFSLTSP